MKTKTYYILAKLENGNSRVYKTETTSKKAAASEIRANGMKVRRVYSDMQLAALLATAWWMLDELDNLAKDYCDQCEVFAF